MTLSVNSWLVELAELEAEAFASAAFKLATRALRRT